MTDKKYILLSLEDSRAKKLSEVLGSKICKKIIDLLAEQELSEKDIADKLQSPINTIEYNLKKLLEAEIVEKAKNFFWSQKGRKIELYKLSNKSIIISPKNSRISSKLKSLLPVALISGAAAVLVKLFYSGKNFVQTPGSFSKGAELVGESSQLAADKSAFIFAQPSIWLWFLSGALIAIVLFAILNWRKL